MMIRTFTGSQEWMLRAACRNYPYFWWESWNSKEAEMAKQICWNECPVRRECLAAAMDMESQDRDWCRVGIWGGLSAHLRMRIAQGRESEPTSMPVDERYERMRKKKVSADG